MISTQQIQEILSLYVKFGWTLRRVLLSPKLKKSLSDSGDNIFPNTEIIESKIDAVWFSRPSGDDKEAWELRRLSATPYALFEMFENSAESEFCAARRKEMESQLE